ncbi:LLM class flavin-dependent oxidoreductase [Sphingobium subterraneum]|uniref:FMN-dependent oxidoreductase (Nitrilotriacetate monooxygenase family) n=1 Tax=Sphingobium subterraneum TaxID=627688 RepID=A0A841IYF0_9SPHN|nr:LLM class flavin-dependent oxidoreductase [Sphingobium subterraneum]MBB6123693.1 FMN-dependent oxidoreductase (nitrilotriacetate monooxygenase family) [Sphingobium subterraneum]
MQNGKMRIGVILDGVGGSNWAWRRPHIAGDASVNIDNYIREAKLAEAAKADFIFIADTLHVTPDSSPHFLNRLEPLTLLGAVATHTRHIGLVATISTSYTEPFTAARQLASLDLISKGRAGWNVVTSGIEGAARNHSHSTMSSIEERYRRAAEHVEVAKGLWDSWEDDAFIRDKDSGVFYDRSKLHALNHKGEFFQVDGPLNIARSPQGHPVLFQAGASDGGRDLAARTADAIFGIPKTIEAAKEFFDDVKARAVTYGRKPDDIIFLAAMDAIVGETEEDAERKYREACEFVRYEDAVKWLGFFFSSHDFLQYDPDAPFPDIGDVGDNSYRSISDFIKTIARTERLTLRDVARRFAIPRTDFIGSAEKVADACENWFRKGAVSGFNVGSSVGRVEDFLELVVPILRKRGLFREEYEFETFRANMGLPTVVNRYTAQAAAREALSA